MTTEFRPTNGFTCALDRDRSKPAQKKPPASIWIGLGIGIIIASIAGDRYVQAKSTNLDIANTRTIASTQGDVCIAQNPTQDAQVALALSEAHLAQTNTNLEKFQSDYSRHKTLALEGKVTPKQLQTAKTAYDLAQLQKSSALQGLQHAQSQLTAVRVENC